MAHLIFSSKGAAFLTARRNAATRVFRQPDSAAT
jgi:hypothetical protein